MKKANIAEPEVNNVPVSSQMAMPLLAPDLASLTDAELDMVDEAVARLKLTRMLRREATKEYVPSSTFQTLSSSRRTLCFLCPHCSRTLHIYCNIQLMDVAEWIPEENERDIDGDGENSSRRLPYRTSGLTEAQIKTIELCRENGLLTAFLEAYNDEWGGTDQVTKRAERILLSFITNAVEKRVPQEIRDFFRRRFPGKAVEFWFLNNVYAVVVGGAIHQFMPAKVFSASSKTLAARMGAERDGKRDFSRWLKTKYGYVPAESQVFLAELRLQSRGVKPGYDGAADRAEY